MRDLPARLRESPHVPIMVQEAIHLLEISRTGTYIDCTVGYGGHARNILSQLSINGNLIGIDRDKEAIKFCEKKLYAFSNVRFFHSSYSKIGEILSLSKIRKVDGMLLDLGMSSAQIDSKNRGFSYKIDSELDMRYDITQELKASDLINNSSQNELADIIYTYGEERRSRSIARNIHRMRPINSVQNLVEAIRISTPPNKRKKTLARVFQAIRIKVNNELHILEDFLANFYDHLSLGGRIVFICFHSLEDRIVKHGLKRLALGKKMKILTKKPLIPSKEELHMNSRSRSAKLRAAERIL